MKDSQLPSHLTSYLDEERLAVSDFAYAIRSPGRINLIGEHTDYTGGLVMPAAIDKALYFLARPVAAAEWRLHAVDLGKTYTLPLPVAGRSGELWVDYLAGIGTQFQDQGHFLPGLEIVFGGDLPRGSGMSSSAALEGGMAFLLNEVLGAQLTRPQLAQLCQRSSNTFLGIPSGVMDQFASLNGLATGPIVLNCHTLEFEPVKDAMTDYTLLLINTMVSHDLSDGAYGERVAACDRALAAIRQKFPDVDYLSAALPAQLAAVRDTLDGVTFRRASYVLAENQRVRSAIHALESGSGHELGRLMNATHAGLRDDYEVSCAELDFLQSFATRLPAVAGARMMGGGFGGCTINLVQLDAVDVVVSTVRPAYRKHFGLDCEVYPVRLAAGTSEF